MNLVISMAMILMKMEWVNKRGKVSLETSMSHTNVLMPYSWWRGDSRALSPVESILNFIWVLRSTRIWTLLSLPHRCTCLPLLLSYNLPSALHRCRCLRYSAKGKPVSSSSSVFPLLSYTSVQPSSDSNNSTNLVCLPAEILWLFSPILCVCARIQLEFRI